MKSYTNSVIQESGQIQYICCLQGLKPAELASDEVIAVLIKSSMDMPAAADASAATVKENIAHPAEVDEAAAEPPTYMCCPLTLVSCVL